MTRRQIPRISCNLRVQGAGGNTVLAGSVANLSGIGLFLKTQQTIPVGKQVHLEFELPTGPVEAVGEVRRVVRGPELEERGIGIRFLRLSATSARAIDAHIEQPATELTPDRRHR